MPQRLQNCLAPSQKGSLMSFQWGLTLKCKCSCVLTQLSSGHAVAYTRTPCHR